MAHALLEFGAEAWCMPGVFGHSGIHIGCGAALESIAANESRLSRFFVNVTESRNVKPLGFTIFIDRGAACEGVEEASRANSTPVIYEVTTKYARRIAQSVRMLP